MKSLFFLTATFVLSSNVYSYDRVSEILPGGKLLICKNSTHVKNGNMVEIHKRSDPKSLSDSSTVKVSELKLPEAGQKIKLSHRDYHAKGKNSDYHAEELGTAVISNASLEGEERKTLSLSKDAASNRVESISKITKEEAEKIQRDCLVAIPENGLKLNEKAYVSW